MDWRDTARGPPARDGDPQLRPRVLTSLWPRPQLTSWSGVRSWQGPISWPSPASRSELGHSRDTTWPGQGIALWWDCLSWKKVACGLNLSTRTAPTPEPVWHPGVSGAEPGLGALPAVQSLGLRPPGPRCHPLGTLPRLGGPDARRAWGRGAALSSCLPAQAGLLAASKPVPQTQSGPQTGSLEAC